MALLQGNTYLLPIRIEDCEGDIVRDEQVERGEFVVGEITKFYGVGGEVVWSEEQQAFIMPLTEQETFGFKKGAIKYQGRVYLKDGSVSGSVPTSEYVYESIGTTILSDGGVGEDSGKVLTIRLLDRVINTGITEEVDPTVPQYVKEITEQDIENWNKVNKLGNVFKYKGSVQTYADLPTENNQVGDVWNVVEKYESYPAGTNFAWTPDGTWDALGGTTEVVETLAETIRDNTVQIINANGGLQLGNANTESDGIAIGQNARAKNAASLALGYGSNANISSASGVYTAIGYNAKTSGGDSIQLGSGTNSQNNTLQIYNDNIYNHKTHTATFQNLQIDGVDEYPTLSGVDAPTITTVGKVKQFYVETTTPALYYCSSITGTGTTEDPYVYNWTAVEGGIDTLSGTTAPTSSTIGKLGQIYINTAKNCSYVCIRTNNTTYSRWINIGGGGSKLGSGNTNSYMLGSATDVGDNSVNINGYGTASSSSCVNIGALSGSSSNRNRSTAVGYRANYDANDALALGYYSSANANKSIQIGAGTNTTANSLQIFDDNIYKSDTHTLTVQNAQVNGNNVYGVLQGETDPTEATVGAVGQFYISTATDPASLWLCTKVETVDSTTTYTWTKQGGVSKEDFDKLVNNVTQISSDSGNSLKIGGASGASYKSIAIGNKSMADGGEDITHSGSVAIGYNSYAGNGAVSMSNSTAIGGNSYADSNGVAIGHNSKATGNACIQLCAGTNETPYTLQVRKDNIYNSETHTLTVQNIELNGVDLGTQLGDLNTALETILGV